MFEKPILTPSQEQPKERTIRIDLPSKEPYKKESEDASYADPVRDIFIAADGITRGPHENKSEYPYPSPAAVAAKAGVEAMGKHLSALQTITEQDLLDAARAGNEAIQKVNEQLGLWNNTDYLERDLAGIVMAGMARNGNDLLYAFMGDCGLAVLGADGTISWQSPDEITPIRPHFPKADKVGTKERFVTVRRDFRNKPNAPHPTYGAMTGEPEALSYLRVGTRSLAPGEVALAYSDGITPFLKDETFRKLVVSGDTAAIKRYLDEQSSETKHADDKTLLVSRAPYSP